MHDEALAQDARDPRDDRTPAWLESLKLVEALWTEILHARREGRNVKFECHPNTAACFAEALLHYADLKMPLLRAMVSIEDNIIKSAAIADQMMHDEITRFAYCVADLEILLENFIGRPAMSLQEIRDRQQDGQPTVRDRYPRSKMAASQELVRSVRTGRIGDPREPGQEG